MNSRKEFKQYFTPPRIADFIIEFLLKIVPELKGNKLSVIDPSCGEGVFLEKAHSYGLCNAEQCFGVDLDPRLAKDWQNRGFLEEGLRLNQGDGLLLEEGKYDVALGNPPFGLLYLEKAEPAYRSMELVMRTSTGVPPALRDVPQEMMFLEKFVKLLKPGGVFAIILPVGIFKNITMKYIRDWVRKKCRLLAVVNLQKRVFSQTGAAAYTSILFARKIEAQPEDRIIFAQASNIDLKQEEHDDLDKILEGEFRPGHFNGVAVVVKKLLQIVEPDNAYFGEKDYQQLLIVKTLVEMEALPVNIVASPTLREVDGLAMSSRNRNLTEEERKFAPLIHNTLDKAKAMVFQKEPQEIKEWVKKQINNYHAFHLEYFEIADAENLETVHHWIEGKKYVMLIAAHLGKVRLIDNVIINS
ncbi:MAG: pantoate--beta-alanine ligase [Vulcanimicrobiota bacterium]